jgi:hypothetical protein
MRPSVWWMLFTEWCERMWCRAFGRIGDDDMVMCPRCGKMKRAIIFKVNEPRGRK